jgi:hypothetical protein
MRKRLKLSFTTLEESLTLISPLEAYHVLGGNPEGSTLGPGASFSETISHFGSMGFTFSEDEDGNYTFTGGGTYQGDGIQLDEVIINGVRLTRADDDGSENRFSSGIQAMLNRFLDDRTQGSETGENGSDGSDGSAPIIVDSGGGEGGNPSGGTTPGDPWKKDVNGKIITTPTGKKNAQGENYSVDLPLERIILEEVTIKTANDKIITAYKTVGVKDWDGNDLPILDRHRSNCTGLAFANGEVWIFDSEIDSTTQEMSNFHTWLNNANNFESSTSATGATFAVIWDTDNTTGESHIVHSGTIGTDGKFTSKESEKTVSSGQSYSDFVGVKMDAKTGITSTITYYKPK